MSTDDVAASREQRDDSKLGSHDPRAHTLGRSSSSEKVTEDVTGEVGGEEDRDEVGGVNGDMEDDIRYEPVDAASSEHSVASSSEERDIDVMSPVTHVEPSGRSSSAFSSSAHA